MTRRDFLKLASSILTTTVLSRYLPTVRSLHHQNQQRPNIVVLVCDAMTARNLSLYGYSRKTTPNLDKLAERAFIYHRHYSNGSFTTPGTSSLLTGLTPLTHRAVNASATVKKSLASHNIFNFLVKDTFKAAYTQNYWADYLLNQFSDDMDELLPMSAFDLIKEKIVNHTFKNDALVAQRSLEKMLYYSSSLVLSFISSLYYQSRTTGVSLADYPLGLPSASYFSQIFTLESLFQGITDKILELGEQHSSFFAYFHVYPPHLPYRPRKEFFDLFQNDGYQPVLKPEHRLSDDSSQAKLNTYRSQYDGFLANIDMEIDKMLSTLEKKGVLDNTYFVITSDHGESFERGLDGHFTPLMYETLIRVPLIVLAPGNQTRHDFFNPTSNIDILPTLLTLSAQDVPGSCEGNVLPGLGGTENPERSILVIDAKENAAFKPLTKATFAIVKGNYKLIYYRGYKGIYRDYFEFYNLEEDPEELHDRHDKPKYEEIISLMKNELLNAIAAADKPYT